MNLVVVHLVNIFLPYSIKYFEKINNKQYPTCTHGQQERTKAIGKSRDMVMDKDRVSKNGQKR